MLSHVSDSPVGEGHGLLALSSLGHQVAVVLLEEFFCVALTSFNDFFFFFLKNSWFHVMDVYVTNWDFLVSLTYRKFTEKGFRA